MILAGLAFMAWRLFVHHEGVFTQPATWVRIIILGLAGLLAAGCWARWLRGRPVRGGRHFALTFGVVLVTAGAMYGGSALFMINQRSQSIDLAFPDHLGGRAMVELTEDEQSAVELGLLLDQGLLLDNDDYWAEFALYEGPSGSPQEQVMVMVITAYRGSARHDGMADNFDPDLTAELLSTATDVSSSRSVPHTPGSLRCGTVVIDDGTGPLCVWVHGIQAVMVSPSAADENPDGLAKAMVADLVGS